MRILGIDGGLHGGAAILITGGDLDGEARFWGMIDIPTYGDGPKHRVDVRALRDWIVAGRPDAAFIERAQTVPDNYRKRRQSSSGPYMRAVGATEATIILCSVPPETVEPRTWKGHFDLPGMTAVMRAQRVSEDQASRIAKERARVALLNLMPSAHKMLARKSDHNRAEAGLIAMYGADLIESRGGRIRSDTRLSLDPAAFSASLVG